MDPYVYPGTNVLKNLRDIRDLLKLAAFEAAATGRRIRQLEEQPFRGKFNAAHLQAIHRHIFEDVYPRAGEFRTVNIARPGQFYFAFEEQIAPCIDTMVTSLARKNTHRLRIAERILRSRRVLHGRVQRGLSVPRRQRQNAARVYPAACPGKMAIQSTGRELLASRWARRPEEAFCRQTIPVWPRFCKLPSIRAIAVKLLTGVPSVRNSRRGRLVRLFPFSAEYRRTGLCSRER